MRRNAASSETTVSTSSAHMAYIARRAEITQRRSPRVPISAATDGVDGDEQGGDERRRTDVVHQSTNSTLVVSSTSSANFEGHFVIRLSFSATSVPLSS